MATYRLSGKTLNECYNNVINHMRYFPVREGWKHRYITQYKFSAGEYIVDLETTRQE